jgi:segregation and condensation protein A
LLFSALSDFTAEYLRYMEELTEDELDAASDFLTVAAQLVYLKSRHLLPRPAPLEEDEEEDPEEAFIRRLKEYKIYRAAGEELSALYEQARLRFARLPEELPPPKEEADLNAATTEGLLKAFLQALVGAREPEETTLEHRVRQDTYTVRERSGLIRKKLMEKQHLSFRELLSEAPTRMEVVVTFMAVLEMMARGEVHITQGDTFAPIRIHMRALREDGEDTVYMDEEEALPNGESFE